MSSRLQMHTTTTLIATSGPAITTRVCHTCTTATCTVGVIITTPGQMANVDAVDAFRQETRTPRITRTRPLARAVAPQEHPSWLGHPTLLRPHTTTERPLARCVGTARTPFLLNTTAARQLFPSSSSGATVDMHPTHVGRPRPRPKVKTMGGDADITRASGPRPMAAEPFIL